MKKPFIQSYRRRVTTFATIALSFAGSGLIALDAPAAPANPALHCESAQAKPSEWVSGKVMIKAPAAAVWKTIHQERYNDPDLCYSKIVEQTNANECKLEQKFNFLPIIGTSVCLMSNKEVPNERIDYALIRSDRFKAMEGSWILTPSEDGKSTELQLSSHLDLGLPVPRSFMNGVTSKKIQKRLANIKRIAEVEQAKQVAVKEEAPAH